VQSYSNTIPRRENEVTKDLIITRKWFHVLSVLTFLSAILCSEVQFLAFACGCVLMALVLLETIRLYGYPSVVADYVQLFCSRFIDKRDSGTLIVTHIYLLVGLIIPVVSEILRIFRC